MTLNSDANFEWTLTLRFRMAWRIGWTFIGALKSLKNCTFIGSSCPQHIMFQPENIREIMCHDTEGWWKIWKKIDSWLEKWKNDLVNFHASSQTSESLHLHWLLLSKEYKGLDEKVLKTYVSWHWRVM